MVNSAGFGPEFGLLVKTRRAERGLSQDALAALLWPDANPLNQKDHPRKPDISRLETGRVGNPQEKTVLLICEKLGIRQDEVNALRLTPPPDPYALAKVLGDLKAASQADLYELARAFGMEDPERSSDTALRAFLADKAQEYHAYRTQIDALDDRVAAIANLKGAAQDAAERLDFDAVETLLERVHTVDSTSPPPRPRRGPRAPCCAGGSSRPTRCSLPPPTALPPSTPPRSPAAAKAMANV